MPHVNEVWQYEISGDHYVIKDIGMMKIGWSAEWIEAVTYMCVVSFKVYTRDMSTFTEKFKKV